MYPEDSAFGAKHEAYSCPWTGVSLANPEPDHHQMNKAVRWAIGSALTHPHIATATIFFLPVMKISLYTACLAHPSVHLIAHVPAQRYKNTNPDYWTGGARHKTAAKKSDMNIFVVCNDAGKNHIAGHFDSDFMRTFKTCTGQTPKTLPHSWSNNMQHAKINDTATVAFKCPQKLTDMLQNPCNPTTEDKTSTRHSCCCTNNPKINPSPSRADPSNDIDQQTIQTIINEISSSADYRPQPLAHN